MCKAVKNIFHDSVTPRERRVSRNDRHFIEKADAERVTPRERRVSRNIDICEKVKPHSGHASREACE